MRNQLGHIVLGRQVANDNIGLPACLFNHYFRRRVGVVSLDENDIGASSREGKGEFGTDTAGCARQPEDGVSVRDSRPPVLRSLLNRPRADPAARIK